MFQGLFSNLDPQKNEKKTNDDKKPQQAFSFFSSSQNLFENPTEESKQGSKQSDKNPPIVDWQKMNQINTNPQGNPMIFPPKSENSNSFFNLQNLSVNPKNDNTNNANNFPFQDESSMFGIKPFYIPKPEEKFPNFGNNQQNLNKQAPNFEDQSQKPSIPSEEIFFPPNFDSLSIKSDQKKNIAEQNPMYPLFGDIGCPPLKFEHDLQKDKTQNFVFNPGKLDPTYFEQNKQEIEKLKQFHSNVIPKISEAWLKKIKVKKYKELFQEFIQKIDALNIEYEEKNQFLDNLEKVFLLYEEEILIDDKTKTNLNNFYGERVENSLVLVEEEQKFEDLVKQRDNLLKEAEKQKKLVDEKIKEKHNEDLNKNEKVVALTKEINQLTPKISKLNAELEKIMQVFEKTTKITEQLDANIYKFTNNKDINDYCSLEATCENSINELKKLHLEPLKEKEYFNIWLHLNFIATKSNYEEKNRILDAKIDDYSKEIRNLKEKTNKMESEINEINYKIIKSKLILKELSLEHKEQSKIYSDLRCENLVLQQSDKKIDKESENKQNLEELYHKAQEFDNKKKKVDHLKNELFLLKNQNNNDYAEMNQQISEEIKYLKKKILDLEIEKINNKSADSKPSRLNNILFYLFYLISFVMILFIICDTIKKFSF